MEIVYYRTNSGKIPVKEYLQKYIPDRDDDENKKRNWAKINSVINLAAERGGIPGGEFSSSVPGYKFHKLKIRGNNKLQVRILYFCFNEERLVLLNIWEKPKLYEKGRGNREKITEENICKITKTYYENFLKNPNQYEKYE